MNIPPGTILTVTGILAIGITLVRGANIGMSRRFGLIARTVLMTPAIYPRCAGGPCP